MKTYLLRGFAVLIACILALSGAASAAELTVQTPSAPSGAGDVITIPVILKNDIEFAGFGASVGNNITGVLVTISEKRPISNAGYTVNSKEENTVQKLNALLPVGSPGIIDTEIELFDIDIKVTDSDVKSIPLELTLRSLITASGEEIPLDTVKMIDIPNIRLTDTLTASVKAEIDESVAASAIPTSLPISLQMPQEGEKTSTAESAPSVTVSQTQNVQTPTALPVNPVHTQPQSPGFGILSVVLGLIGVAGVIRMKKGA